MSLFGRKELVKALGRNAELTDQVGAAQQAFIDQKISAERAEATRDSALEQVEFFKGEVERLRKELETRRTEQVDPHTFERWAAQMELPGEDDDEYDEEADRFLDGVSVRFDELHGGGLSADEMIRRREAYEVKHADTQELSE